MSRIPIFVSSSHHGLEDLRGELASFLEDLGLEPVLSSETGFPDHPGIPPHVQCLRVLERTLLIIGIIDKRYGQKLNNWEPYPDYAGLSPTHAELRHALAQRKRVLIYVRTDMQGYHEIYRNNKETFAELNLPPQLEVGSLEMYSEMDLATPAPWIEAFRDVRDIKQSIRSRLLYDLLEALTQKEKLAQSGVDILIDLMLKVDKPDLVTVGKLLDLMSKQPLELRMLLRDRLEELFADAKLMVSKPEMNVETIPTSEQQASIAHAPKPQDYTRIEREVLKILWDNQKVYLRRADVYELLTATNRPTVARVGQILAYLHQKGLLLRMTSRSQGNVIAGFYALSAHGVEACRRIGLEPHSTASMVTADVQRPLNQLIDMALDASRPSGERTIAIGALLNNPRAWGNQVIHSLHEVILKESDPTRLSLAKQVLGTVLQRE